MRKREALEARIVALRKEFEDEEEDATRAGSQEASREKIIQESRGALARSRQADEVAFPASGKTARNNHEKNTENRGAATS
jgi:hypothetical protein